MFAFVTSVGSGNITVNIDFQVNIPVTGAKAIINEMERLDPGMRLGPATPGVSR